MKKKKLTDIQHMNFTEWYWSMKERASIDLKNSIKIFNSLTAAEQYAIYTKRWYKKGDITPIKRPLLPKRFKKINNQDILIKS
tara:strand:+ start:1017 stop:1265 length:249 start_codon:yes stop_codon:yes gene_type:complete